MTANWFARHEYLRGGTKVDRNWWMATKLAALTVVCFGISYLVFVIL